MDRVFHLSLAKRLYLSFGLVFAMLVAVVAITYLGMDRMGAKERQQNAEQLVQVHAAGAASASSGDMHFAQTRYVLIPNQRGDYLTDRSVFEKDLAHLQAVATSPQLKQSVAAVKSAYGEFNKVDAQLWSSVQHGDRAAARTLVEGGANDTADALREATMKVQDQAEASAAALHGAFTTDAASAKTLVIVLALAAILLGSLTAFLTVRHIRRNVQVIIQRLDEFKTQRADVLTEGLGALAAGDLSRSYPIETTPVTEFPRDELGQIQRVLEELRERLVAALEAYNGSTDRLRSAVGHVAQTANSVSSSSHQMASTSEEAGKATREIAHALGDVAHGADRQVKMVEAAKRSAEEVARAVTESAQNANNAAEVAQDARQVAQQGVSAAEQANEAMRSVSDSSQAVTEAIRELSNKSEQIGAIVQTITGIADQTNLLALNAAIEAARAGEQGRGFAVVAEEVRKLAEESQHAAQEIGKLIGAIQGETTRAVGVVDDGAKRTQDGARVVEQTRAAFQRIDTAVEDMTARIEQIAAAGQQIAAGAQSMQESIGEVAAVAEQCSASTEEVSASTEQTTASAQEIAASAHELASNADQLNHLVAQFKTSA
jgi:methyl-accepting chemotaxis protein